MPVMDEKKCRVCKRFLPKESLLRLPGMPGAVQNLPLNRSEAISYGVELDVRQCPFCGLVQLTNDPVPYYKDVIRAGSISPSMRVRQLAEFRQFIDRFSLEGKRILEIGSGRGEYLSILNELPVTAYGMEHNPAFNRIAANNGLKTFQAYPTDLVEPPEGIIFDGFLSINFLEHAPDPGGFLCAAANCISENGVGMVAVPDFEFEMRDNFVFSFMRDHLSYFTASSLGNLLSLNGFEVIDIHRNEKLNVVTAYLKKRRQYKLSLQIRKLSDFRRKINETMDAVLNAGSRIAVWGASHLAFSVISAANLENKISYIVDAAPFKQGNFSPATGIKIFPPQYLLENPVDTIAIMCPEYSDEIVANIEKEYAHIIRHILTFKNGDLESVN